MKKVLFVITLFAVLALNADGIMNCNFLTNEISSYERLLDAEYYQNRLYCADFSNGVRIFNINDIFTPVELGNVSVNGDAQRFCISGDYLHVACRNGGVSVIDMSSAIVPGVLASYDDGSMVTGIWGDSDYVYSACGTGGIKVFHLVGDTLVLTDSCVDMAFNSNDLFVKGDYAYVCNWEFGTAIVNVENKSDISVVATIPTDDYSCEAAVKDTILYYTEFFDGLICVNVKNPSAPVVIDSIILSGGGIDLHIEDDNLFVGNFEGVYIFYIEENGDLTLSGFYEDNCESRGICTHNDTIFSCTDYAGLNIYEYVRPAGVSENNLYNNSKTQSNIELIGDYLKINMNCAKSCNVKIYDSTGREVYGAVKVFHEGSNYLKMDILKIGVYFVSLEYQGKNIVEKIYNIK